MNKKENRLVWIIMFFFLIFYIWVAAQIPYTHDDWDWGLQEGINYLLTASLNSRYAGNFIVVLLTRSVLLKTLVMGIVFWLIPILLTKLVSNKNDTLLLPTYLLCNMFPMLMQHYVLVQTYNWVSGFANYLVSGLLLLVHLLFIRELLSDDEITKPSGKLQLFGFWVFGVIIQLFLENITVFMVLLSAVTLWYSIRRKRNVVKYIALFVGNLVGMIIMFSSSMYQTLIAEGSSLGGIREMAFHTDDGVGAISIIFENIWTTWIPYMVSLNFKFYLVIIGVLICFAIKHRKLRSNVVNTSFLFSIPALLIVLLATSDWGIFFILFAIIIFLVLCLYIENKTLKIQCIIMYIAHFAVIAPLVVLDFVNTSPHRLFMTSNLFLMLLIALIFNHELSQSSKKIYSILLVGFSIVMLIGVFHSGSVYYQIGKTNREYKKIIETSISNGSEKVSFPIDEHYDSYLWRAYPRTEKRKGYFKRFYGLPETVELDIDVE